MARSFGEPGIITNRQSEPALAGQVERHPVASGVIGFAGPPGKDLAIGGQHPTVRAIDTRRIEQLASRPGLDQGAGHKTHAQAPCKSGQGLIQRAVQRHGRGPYGRVGLGKAGGFRMKKVQLRKDDHVDALTPSHEPADLFLEEAKISPCTIWFGLDGQNCQFADHDMLETARKGKDCPLRTTLREWKIVRNGQTSTTCGS